MAEVVEEVFVVVAFAWRVFAGMIVVVVLTVVVRVDVGSMVVVFTVVVRDVVGSVV